MEARNLTCIGCPLGCPLTAAPAPDGTWNVTGHTCKRGQEYAQKELTNPSRTLTSTVRITGAAARVVSVRTAADIPKEKLWEAMKEINHLSVPAPVRMGDILLADIAGTGVALVATKTLEA